MSQSFGFSKAFFETPTTTTNNEWVRRFAVIGLWSGLALGVVSFIVSWLIASLPVWVSAFALVALMIAMVCGFFLLIARDVDFNGDLKE